MAYDRTKEQTIVISKVAHTQLKDFALKQKRSLRNTLELLIEEYAKS